MKTIYQICMIFLVSIFCFAQINNSPIRTPANFGGIDTMSKFSASLKKNLLNKNVESKIPLRKQGENKILDLITDPRVVYSSYLGGNGYDCGNGIAVDSKDNIYIVGYTGSTDFPTTDGCFQKEKSGGHDAFIAKFSPNGEKLLWCTYYGGTLTDVATGCVIDSDDNLIIVGKTDSKDFPVDDSTKSEQWYNDGAIDIFLMKFDGDGKRIWARYYGGQANDIAEGIALKSDENIVIAGGTTSLNLPVKGTPFQAQNNGNTDVFISEFNKDGKLVYATYIGGYQYEMAHSLAVDKWDDVAIVGHTKCVDPKGYQSRYPLTGNSFQNDTSQNEDCIITIFDANWNFKYSTYYGGHQKNPRVGEGIDIAYGCTFDNDGNLYLCGYTTSYDFPITLDAYKSKYDSMDGFILKFDGYGNRIWATLYGGSDLGVGDIFYDISYNENNKLFLTGSTNSPTYPIINGNVDGRGISSNGGIALLEIGNSGKPLYSDYYNGYLTLSYKVIFKNNIYITGYTESYGFLCTKNAIINWNEDISQEPASCYLLNLNAEKLTSVNSNDLLIDSDNLIIYPNPVLNQLYIYNKNFKEIINLIEIYDLYGRKIIEKEIHIQDVKFIIDTSLLLTGFYSIQIHTNKDIYSIKIIKN